METRKFFGTITAKMLEDPDLLQSARNFTSGRSNTLIVQAEGRTFQFIRLSTISAQPKTVKKHLSAEDVLRRVMKRWKNHETLLDVFDGKMHEVFGTKKAIADHKAIKADSSHNNYIELSDAEIDAFEKEALDSVTVIKLDRECVVEGSLNGEINAPATAPEEKSVTTRATQADLLFARMIGRLISRVIQAKEQDARKLDTERRDETRKQEMKAEELQRHIVKKEIDKQELRKETLKHESNKLKT